MAANSTGTDLLEQADDTVLYDIFFEMGTKLGGRLVALERKAEANGDAKLAEQWREEQYALDDERASVKTSDRAEQIRTLRKWRDRRNELKALL